MEFYKNSGAVTVSGLIMTILAGGVTAAVLGVVYTFAIVYIPFIYINFLLTAGFALVLGLVTAKAAYIGKIRNGMVVGLCGFMSGLFGLYVAWATDPMARGAEVCAFQPGLLLSYVQFFYENGAWGLGRNGDNISGIFLALVWLIEAAVIVGGAALISGGANLGKTFCERCHQWTSLEKGLSRLSIADSADETLERVLGGDLAGLADMIRVNSDEDVYLRVDLATCGTCSESNFMSLVLVTHGVDDKGKATVETQNMIENMIVDEQQVPLLHDAGRDLSPEELAKKESDATPQPGDLDFLDKPQNKADDFKPEDLNIS